MSGEPLTPPMTPPRRRVTDGDRTPTWLRAIPVVASLLLGIELLWLELATIPRLERASEHVGKTGEANLERERQAEELRKRSLTVGAELLIQQEFSLLRAKEIRATLRGEP